MKVERGGVVLQSPSGVVLCGGAKQGAGLMGSSGALVVGSVLRAMGKGGWSAQQRLRKHNGVCPICCQHTTHCHLSTRSITRLR